MNRYVHRFVIGAALACAALPVIPASHPALAQPPAFAIGKPLPEASMPVGTVTVRVIAGTPAAAVAGADVTLTVNGQPRVEKSDGSGRATFRDLPVGASVQAKILDAEQQPQTSEAFPIPSAGGVRVMLSTKPYTGAPASHGAPASAGAGGAPEARAMSGQPRPDQATKPGTYQVRLTYNNLSVKSGQASDSEPPIGEVVTLVGYHSNNSVDVRTLPVDDKGYATFEQLDISGHTTYMALARLPRAGGVDRLTAVPVQPDTQVGAKVILSSDKRTATTPPIDEARSEQSIPTPAGKVRVTLEGVPVETAISLIDAATGKPLGEQLPGKGAPDPRNVEGAAAPFAPSADLAPGAVVVAVRGGQGNSDAGLPGVAVRVIPADQDNAEGVSGTTGADGTAQLQVPTGKAMRAVLNVNGKDLVSSDFDVTKSGGTLAVTVRWEAEGRPEAMFDVEYRPDLVVYAEVRAKLPGAADAEAPQVYRSRPVQLLEATGVHLPITVYPRILINFSKRAIVEDEMLGVRGTFIVQNLSWAPYSAGPDGMVLPLPKGFQGGKISEEHQSIASIAPGEGVRLVRPLSPGRTQFIVGYTLVSEGGELQWHLDLPYDTFQSGMEIKLQDGMTVRPQGSRGRTAEAQDGSQWFVLDDISIRAGKAMVMDIAGMPSQPPWRLWLPRVIGVLVVGLMFAGVLFALLRRPAATAASASDRRRTALLDELVELERTGKDPARREQVLAELERTWRE